jgi:hypothetical protein
MVKVYRLLTTRMSYEGVLKISKMLSSFYSKIESSNLPNPIKKLLGGLVPDKSSYGEWRECYIFDRLTARNWNFYPQKVFENYLLNAGFKILNEGNYRSSFVCSKKSNL